MHPVQELLLTADGSHSIRMKLPEGTAPVSYHSAHGALAESRQVFIATGLQWALERFPEGEMEVLEIGLGTGLNALLTALEIEQQQRRIHYTALELFPLEATLAAVLNYPDLIGEGHEMLAAIHESMWNSRTEIAPFLSLEKRQQDAAQASYPAGCYHLIFLDAFAPEDQPQLWTEAMFQKLYDAAHPGGALVTYCSKSAVRRAMGAAGWCVEKLPGPKGKREIVRAIKPPLLRQA